MALSPDGRLIATHASGSKTIQLWDALTGAVEDSVTFQEEMHGPVIWGPNGQWLAAGSLYDNGLVRIWDLQSRTLIHELRGLRGMVVALAVDSKGERIAAGSWDGRAVVWSIASGEVVLEMEGEDNVFLDLAFDPGGRWLAAAGRGHVRLLRAVPATFDLAARRAARLSELRVGPIVDSLFIRHISRRAVLDALENAPVLDPRVRDAARRVAWVHRSEPQRLDLASRETVRSRGRSAEEYWNALELALEAADEEFAPERFRTLGMALYRAARYEDALATLSYCREIDSLDGSPEKLGDIALCAMCEERTGSHDQALLTLARANYVMALPEYSPDVEDLALLQEATILISQNLHDSP